VEYGWAGHVRDRSTASIGKVDLRHRISPSGSNNLAETSAGIFVGGLDEAGRTRRDCPPIKKFVDFQSFTVTLLCRSKLLRRPQRRDHEQNAPMTPMLSIEAQPKRSEKSKAALEDQGFKLVRMILGEQLSRRGQIL